MTQLYYERVNWISGVAFYGHGIRHFLFGIARLGLPLLWFRIRELADRGQERG